MGIKPILFLQVHLWTFFNYAIKTGAIYQVMKKFVPLLLKEQLEYLLKKDYLLVVRIILSHNIEEELNDELTLYAFPSPR